MNSTQRKKIYWIGFKLHPLHYAETEIYLCYTNSWLANLIKQLSNQGMAYIIYLTNCLLHFFFKSNENGKLSKYQSEIHAVFWRKTCLTLTKRETFMLQLATLLWHWIGGSLAATESDWISDHSKMHFWFFSRNSNDSPPIHEIIKSLTF